MIKRFFTLVAAAVSVSACDLPFSSDRDDVTLRAEADASMLSVTNVSSRTVRYLVFERSELALVLWGRCTPEQTECATLAPGQTKRIPYSAIEMYDPGDTEAVVYWWIDDPAQGGAHHAAAEGQVLVRL